MVKRKRVTQQWVKANEKIPSNWKKEREAVTVLDCHLQIQLLHTLSFTLMAKLIRRRRQHKTTKTPRNKITTTPKALDIPIWRPRGTKGMGARGTTPGPKHGRGRVRTAAKTWPGLRFHGPARAARARPPAASGHVCLLSAGSSGLLIWCPGMTKSSP